MMIAAGSTKSDWQGQLLWIPRHLVSGRQQILHKSRQIPFSSRRALGMRFGEKAGTMFGLLARSKAVARRLVRPCEGGRDETGTLWQYQKPEARSSCRANFAVGFHFLNKQLNPGQNARSPSHENNPEIWLLDDVQISKTATKSLWA